MTRTAFTVIADMPVKCCRCRAKLRRDDQAVVHVDATGFVQYEHDGDCPAPPRRVWGEDAHIQGSK